MDSIINSTSELVGCDYPCILFYSILFYSILLYSNLFYSIRNNVSFSFLNFEKHLLCQKESICLAILVTYVRPTWSIIKVVISLNFIENS